MKRLLTIVAFIFSFMFVMAQTSNKHLTFMGIPITGTLENFAQKMEAKGCKKKYSNKRIIGLEGEFAGYSGCKITVFKILNRNIVRKVVVSFPTVSSWTRLEKEYNQFKDMLTNKYGEPTSHSATFKEGASTFRDAAKMSSLKEGNCDYYSKWKVDNGYIKVEIAPIIDTDDGNIRLTYVYYINDALADKAKEDDLYMLVCY